MDKLVHLLILLLIYNFSDNSLEHKNKHLWDI